ncbi:MAG: peptidoglycan-binding protein [Actinomycetota bacterium]|nr:peptidoglycan-binding protein [Actinomycetota bacterium]
MMTRERIERRLRGNGDGLGGARGLDATLRPRRRLALAALGTVGLVAAVLTLPHLAGGGASKPADAGPSTRTATVSRRTLVERESVEGTLGYSGARAVLNRLATGGGSSGGGSAGGGGALGGGGGASSGGGGAAASSGGGDGGSGSRSGGGSSSHSGASSARSASNPRASSTGARAAATSHQRGNTRGDRRGADDDKGHGDATGRKRGDRGNRDRHGRDDTQGGTGNRGARGEPDAQGGRRQGGRGSADNGGRGSRDASASRLGGGSNSGGGASQGGQSAGGGGSGGGGGASQGSGTVTRLAREGSIVDRGEALYALDNRPVVLLYGSIPVYRDLSTASSPGPDVRQLEQNLVALGFGSGLTVDEQFTPATAAAVKRWQRSLGLPQTGEVELGRVVFLPGARRVGSHKTKVGSALATGAEVLETTSVKRVVTVELDVAKQSLVHRGDKVTVTLPDGTTVSGRIARVGRVARKTGEGGGANGGLGGSDSGSGELKIDVTIVLRSHRGVSRLDQAPVTVGIAQEVRRDVLAVPVSALLARPGGGYGVEVVHGGRRRIVAVETGLFAGGFVEISGRGIRAGTKVAIPEE